MSQSTSYLSIRNGLTNFIRPSENKIFNIYEEVGIKLLITRLRLGFSNLCEHKIRDNFEDTLIKNVREQSFLIFLL